MSREYFIVGDRVRYRDGREGQVMQVYADKIAVCFDGNWKVVRVRRDRLQLIDD